MTAELAACNWVAVAGSHAIKTVLWAGLLAVKETALLYYLGKQYNISKTKEWFDHDDMYLFLVLFCIDW